MKLAILGDTHFGMRNDNQAFHDLYRKFYTETFFPYLEEHGIDRVIQLGDLFDRRKYINFNTLKQARDYFFDPLSKKDIFMYTIIGNHDIYYKNTLEVNSTTMLLAEYPNIFVIAEPCKVLFDDKVGVDFIPWICEENEQMIREYIEKSTCDYCVGHFELTGFEMDRGNVCHEGWNPHYLSRYKLALSGHFHHKSQIGNILYCGSPGEITWADYDDPRGFHIFDTKTGEIEFIRNPHTIFRKIVYNDDDMYFDDVAKKDFSEYTGKYLKVIVAKKTNTFLFETFIDRLNTFNPLDVTIVENFNDELNGESEELDEAEDTMTIIDKVVDGLEMDLKKPRLKSILREVYTEALAIES